MVQIHGVMQIHVLKSISLLYKMNFTTCYLFHNFIHINYKISSFAHLVFFREKYMYQVHGFFLESRPMLKRIMYNMYKFNLISTCI